MVEQLLIFLCFFCKLKKKNLKIQESSKIRRGGPQAVGDNKIMEEETYEVTGDVQAQKNAIYEQWLDGAYERIGATAKVLLPAVQSVAQKMGSLTVTDFTARGL